MAVRKVPMKEKRLVGEWALHMDAQKVWRMVGRWVRWQADKKAALRDQLTVYSKVGK